MDDVAVAAFDQDVGHRFAERSALRHGEQMRLAFDPGTGDERRVPEPLRLLEYWLGDVDIVIEGEQVDHVRWSIRDGRQPLRQLDSRFGLDGADEAYHDVVEYPDLLVGIARGAADEEIGDTREHLDTARGSARIKRGFQFVNERKSAHQLSRAEHMELSNNALRTMKKGLRVICRRRRLRNHEEARWRTLVSNTPMRFFTSAGTL